MISLGRGALTSLPVVGLVALASACGPAPPIPASELAVLYEGATPLSEYVDSLGEYHAEWEPIYREANLPDELSLRADSVASGAGAGNRASAWLSAARPVPEGGGAETTRPVAVLVVATAWCTDSRYNVPYVARLAHAFQDLPVRVTDPLSAAEVLRRYRTPDGRGATPTVLLLDRESREVGCWIERPDPLQRYYIERVDRQDPDRLHRELEAWYEQDRGATTVNELAAVLEAAFGGRRICSAG